MRLFRVVLLRLTSLIRSGRLDAETREELEHHYQQQIQQHLDAGLSPDAARRAASLEIGRIDPLVEASRSARGLAWWDGLRADIRYALRQIRKRPGFSAAGILTLTLGVGATAAVFAVVDSVLLRPLPYGDSSRLYSLYEINVRGNVGRTKATALNYMDWRTQARSFSDMAAHVGTAFTLTGRGEPEFTLGQLVTTNLLDVLQVKPQIGRTFLPIEAEAGNNHVVILTHALWMSYFAGDHAVVNSVTTINGQPYQIVGVLPPSFSYPSDEYRLLTPLVTKGSMPGGPPMNRNARYLRVIARLNDGATEAAARSELDVIGKRLASEYPDSNGTVSIGLSRLMDDVIGGARTNLVVVLVAVGFVLLIACVNVAGLSIARGHARSRELAVRTAIGASRNRLVRQLATEGFVLFAIGGTLGLVLAAWTVTALASTLPASIPRVGEIAVDVRFLLVAGGFTMLTGFVSSILPALQVGRRGVAGELAGTRGTVSSTASTHRTRAVLIVVQVAVAVVLLMGAALALRSLERVNAVEKGFDPTNTMTFGFVMRETAFPTATDVRGFVDRVNAELTAAAPTAIASVGTTTHLPLIGNNLENTFTIDGVPIEANQDPPLAGVRGVSGRYRAAVGAHLLEGRDFQPGDGNASQPVAIVTADFAKKYMTAARVIGARLKMGGADSDDPWRTVVGVVADIRHAALDRDPRPEVWIPFSQLPDDLLTTWLRGVNVVARTTVDPVSTIPALRATMRRIGPDIPLISMRSMEDLAAASTAERRLQTSLLSAFATIALTLAAIGLFGVLAFYVAQHVPEFGVRLALGATPAELLSHVMRRGLMLLAIGLAIGAPGAVLLGRQMSTLLYGIEPMDPPALGSAITVLACVTLAACVLPARRAMKTDPLVALRTD